MSNESSIEMLDRIIALHNHHVQILESEVERLRGELKEKNDYIQKKVGRYGTIIEDFYVIKRENERLQSDLARCRSERLSAEDVRIALAEYIKTEGCSCCSDVERHKQAEGKLAELLNPSPYSDGSGWDWSKQLNTDKSQEGKG